VSDINSPAPLEETIASPDLSSLVITLLKGVIYEDNNSTKWSSLLSLQSRVRDYVSVIGLELMLDEAEGYAFLRSKSLPETSVDDDLKSRSNKPLPRLITRRQLSFPVSLLLALLRKKLAEFDAQGGDTRLVLSRDEIVELIRVFLPSGSNEVKISDQVDSHINKVVELGFLRRLKPESHLQAKSFEVRRILKSFVDAQWLADFDSKLALYKIHSDGSQEQQTRVENDRDE